MLTGPSQIVDIRWIEKQTAICGVERILLLDLYKQNPDFSSKVPLGVNNRVFEEVVQNASSNSPVGFYFNYNDTFPPKNAALLAQTILNHFSSHAQRGLEISFPAIGELISGTFKEKSSDTMTDSCGHVPCFVGNKVVILPSRKAGSPNDPLFARRQIQERDKADQLLEQVFNEHEEWLSNGRPSPAPETR